MKAKRLIIRLYFIHLFAGLAIALSMYFAGFDIVLSLVYVIINVREVLTKLKFAAKVKAIILWQLPGIISSIASVAAVGDGDRQITPFLFWSSFILRSYLY